jgi:hypothetical protein
MMPTFTQPPVPKNPPELMALVEVASLGGFCVGGRLVAAGTVLKLPKYIADSLIHQKKAELLCS